MKLLDCPLNGPRNISEFVYGGEYAPEPDAFADLPERARFVYFPRNEAGVVIEWWCHAASGYWFLAERDTRSDEILRTFPVNELHAQARHDD